MSPFTLPRAAAPRRRGFTFVELLTVILILGLLTALSMPHLLHARSRTFTAALQSDLRNLAMAEEAYYYQHGAYTPDMAQLPVLASPGVTLTISAADGRGWGATAVHPSADRRTCAVFHGAPPSRPAPATSQGEIACQ